MAVKSVPTNNNWVVFLGGLTFLAIALIVPYSTVSQGVPAAVFSTIAPLRAVSVRSSGFTNTESNMVFMLSLLLLL